MIKFVPIVVTPRAEDQKFWYMLYSPLSVTFPVVSS